MDNTTLDISIESTTAPGNTSEDPPWKADIRTYQYYILGVVCMCVISLGLIGNTLTVIILTRRSMRGTTNMFLAALAVWDCVVLIMTLAMLSLNQVSPYYQVNIHAYVVVYAYPVALVAQTATIWITVSFTVERYIAVCHPLQAASMCTIARARIVITCVSLFSIIYNVCRWFEYKIKYSMDTETNSTSVSVDLRVLGANETYRKVYFLFLYLPIMCFIPLLSLFVLNMFLIRAVKKSQEQRRGMNVKQSRENNVTIMLVSVVIVFIICQVPALVYNTAYAVDKEVTSNTFGWELLSIWRNFSVTLNSAVNFILYCAIGQKFRKVFMRNFCHCFLHEEDSYSLTYHASNIKQKKTFPRLLQEKTKAEAYEAMDLTSSSGHTCSTVLTRCSTCTSRNSSYKSGSAYQVNHHHDNCVKTYTEKSSRPLDDIKDEKSEETIPLNGNNRDKN